VLLYQQLKHHPRALRAFTGLDQAEFDKLIGKYLSSVGKLDAIVAPEEGFEAQL
jgi:hypothetical protein